MIAVAILVVAAVLLWPARGGVDQLRRPGPSTCEAVPVMEGGESLRRSGGLRGPPRSRHAGLADRLDRRAQLAELVTVGLEAGLPTEAAWSLAHAVHSSSPRVRAVTGSRADGSPGDLLDRALALSDLCGTPAASASRAAARALRDSAAATRRRDSLLAGPRASMAVLALLPVIGPLVAGVTGLPLTRVYAVGPALWSVLVGLLFTGTGWWVSRWIIDAAARPATLRSTARPDSHPPALGPVGQAQS